MKIAVFKFEVSNSARCPLKGDETYSWYVASRNRLVDTDTVERKINRFCEDKDVVDIKVNTVDAQYHNNARGNTIELWYTVMYK